MSPDRVPPKLAAKTPHQQRSKRETKVHEKRVVDRFGELPLDIAAEGIHERVRIRELEHSRILAPFRQSLGAQFWRKLPDKRNTVFTAAFPTRVARI